MRFRFGVLTGFAAGYVLGAKAGRERYVQIQEQWAKLTRSEPVQQLSEEVRHAAAEATHAVEQKAEQGVNKVVDLVRGEGADSNGSDAAAGDTGQSATATGTTGLGAVPPPYGG